MFQALLLITTLISSLSFYTTYGLKSEVKLLQTRKDILTTKSTLQERKFGSLAPLPGPTSEGTTTAGWTDDGSIVRLNTASDNVGIGTANPSTKLQVQGNAYITGNLDVSGGTFNFSQGTATTTITVDTSRRLGFASGTPSSFFSVQGNTSLLGGTTTISRAVFASSTFQARGVEYTWPSADGTNGQALTTNGAGALSFNAITVTSATTFDVATSSGSSLFNMRIEGGALIGGTTTISRLLLASSSIEALTGALRTPRDFTVNGVLNADGAISASSSLLVNSRLLISTTTPSENRNLFVNGGSLISGTTTVSKLVIASSTLEARGLTYTLPTSHTAPPSGAVASSTLFNNGRGELYFGLPFDIGASTTAINFTGNLTYGHALGRIPALFEIYMTAGVDNAGTAELATSHGFATSTSQTTNASGRVISNTVRAAAAIAYTTDCYGIGLDCTNSTAVAVLEDTGDGEDVNVRLVAWDSTSFTLNWATNSTGGGNGPRRYIWKIQ